MINFTLTFDNAGGITLQTADYCHHFLGREREAAERVSELLDGDTTAEWEGNEPEHRIAEGIEYDAEDVLTKVVSKEFDGGSAERMFFSALSAQKMIKEIEERAGGVKEAIALLGVTKSAWYRYRSGEDVPLYIQCSIEAHLSLSKKRLSEFLKARS